MKQKTKKIILFGSGDLAQIANIYFTRDTEYSVSGFTIHKDYIKEKSLMGLPVVPFEDVETYFPPESHEIHVCIVYDDLNRTRAKICKESEEKRYELASYISPHAFIASTVKLGKHHFIFESNVIQDFVEIGDNLIMWSGDHCGHHSRIGNNVFISSHVVISGHCDIGSNTFLGVNCTIPNDTKIGKESWVMHGAVIPGDIAEHSLVRNVRADSLPLNEGALLRALERKKS